MAGLFIRSEARELNPALGSIGELKTFIERILHTRLLFTDVVNTPGEVAGNRNGCRVSVLHLHIAGRRFWRVVVCSCDGGSEEAEATVVEVIQTINNLVS